MSSSTALQTAIESADDRAPGFRVGTGRSGWTTVITPHRGAFNWRLGQLWRYRDLIMLFVWRDFVSAYKQTILGPAWHIVQPLLTTLTFTVIFGRVAGLSTDGLPQFLFYMAGNVVWTFFSACLTRTANTFVQNASIFGKVYFHRLVIPVSTVFSCLIAFGIQFGLFLVFLAFYSINGADIHPNRWVLATPVLLLMLAGYGLGFGVIVSALTTRYRDLANLVAFGVQLWMYATPVIYPLSSVPEKYRWLVMANPMTPLLEGFRYAFLGAGSFDLPLLAGSLLGMLGVLFVGLLLFTRVEQSFMDTV